MNDSQRFCSVLLSFRHILQWCPTDVITSVCLNWCCQDCLLVSPVTECVTICQSKQIVTLTRFHWISTEWGFRLLTREVCKSSLELVRWVRGQLTAVPWNFPGHASHQVDRACARSAHREFTTNETGTYRSKGYLVNMETSSRQGVFCLLCWVRNSRVPFDLRTRYRTKLGWFFWFWPIQTYDTTIRKWQILYLRIRYRSKLGWFFWFGPICCNLRIMKCTEEKWQIGQY